MSLLWVAGVASLSIYPWVVIWAGWLILCGNPINGVIRFEGGCGTRPAGGVGDEVGMGELARGDGHQAHVVAVALILRSFRYRLSERSVSRKTVC